VLIYVEERAGVLAAAIEREERPPRRPEWRGPVEPCRDLVQDFARVAEVDLLFVSAEAEVEGAAHEGGHDLRPDAVDQAVERRAGGEGGEKCLMVGDLVAHVLKVRRAQGEQLPTSESLRIDPVGHVPERSGLATELLRKTVRIRLRSCVIAALDRDEELVEAREVIRDPFVTLGRP